AEGKASGGKEGFLSYITSNLPNIALNALISLGTATAWKVLCKNYLNRYGLSSGPGSPDLLSPKSLQDVLCGVGGTILRIGEFKDMFNNLFNADVSNANIPLDVPPDWGDACSGLDYSAS
ncbi:hypothetical protein KY348_07260, partial [Candidatus Woesearchaeota archaeon]|nr:hypothetical protein [Candidatus Woesearchaeota archaeon]